MKKVELLAPAGNYEGFLGAIHAGADAVYLGGDRFGARAYADNFHTEELCSAIRYAHLHGKKVYLTLNTLIKEKEFGELYAWLFPFYEAGLDGVIVQDIGVLSWVRRQFPLLPIHVSTQMTVTGVHAAGMLKEAGVQRIVPARELSLREIIKIRQATGLEIETFIHGAMCYCYSGQCLLSSMLGGRSGNRGKCAQPCRLPYDICMDKTTLRNNIQYPMSLKDLCTIRHIPELIAAGIDSFKIEGRMKKPEYTAGVTAVYRKAIDTYYEQGRCTVSEEDMHLLKSLYIRSEIQDGYYFRHNGSEMVTHTAPGYTGSDEEVLERIRCSYLRQEPKLSVRMYGRFYEGEPAYLAVSCGNVQAQIRGDVVSKAQKRPVSRQNVLDGLSAIGGTAFAIEELNVDVQEGVFYPLKSIKDLRRQALETLTRMIEEKNCPGLKMRKAAVPAKTDAVSRKADAAFKESGWIRRPPERQAKENGYRALFMKKEQLFAFLETGIHVSRIYLDVDMCADPGEWKKILKRTGNACAGHEKGNTEIFIVLPHIIRERDADFLQRMLPVFRESDGCMVRNMEGYAWLRKQAYKGAVCGDAGICVWNRETVRFWESRLSGLCMPYELSGREQRDLLVEVPDLQSSSGHGFWEQAVYGYLPVMVTANCMAKTGGVCRGTGQAESDFTLRDRYKMIFPVSINCRHCYNVIYNSVPLSLHGKAASGMGKTAQRLDFTIETPEEVKETLRFFERLSDGEREVAPPYTSYTTGHEKRGAD